MASGSAGPLIAATLAAAPNSGVQKQLLIQELYTRIVKYQPEHARQITDVLLEMNSSDLLGLLESEELLKISVDDAMILLKHYKQSVFNSEPHHSEVLTVKNTFLEPHPPSEDGGGSKASSDPTSDRSSSASSRSSEALSVFEQRRAEALVDALAGRRPQEERRLRRQQSKEQRLISQMKQEPKEKQKPSSSSSQADTSSAASAHDEPASLSLGEARRPKKKKAPKNKAAPSPQAAKMLAAVMGERDSHWSLKLPSIGTIYHYSKSCKPCASFIRGQCEAGANCQQCHARVHLKLAL